MNPKIWKTISYSIVIIGIIAFLSFFNRYQFIHAEQLQLFRFDKLFLAEILSVPGGLSILLEKFILQFNYYPFLGIIIFVGLLAIIYLLLRKIPGKAGHTLPQLAIVPVSLILALHLNYNYHLRSTVAFIFILLLFYSYLQIKRPVLKNGSILILPLLAFTIAGGYVIYLLVLIAFSSLIELDDNQPGFFKIVIFSLLGVFPIYLACRFIFACPYSSIYEACTPLRTLNGFLLMVYVLLLVFLPLILTFKKTTHNFFCKIISKSILYLISILIPWFSYDYKTEKFFEIEHYFTKGNYQEVVKLVEKYPGNNHLVLYLGNIALSKTQQMGERLFHFKQAFGPDGLYMKNEPINVSTYYGGALYQHLLYTNEARHWNFNSLVINGDSPETLKKLVNYELVNGNYNVAKKYIQLLSQTIFYRKWALEYYKYVKSPLLIESNEEMARLRKYLATNDFYHDRFDLQLKSLLAMYPDNRAAFDYLVSYTLLKKDLNSFMDALSYLREFRMTTLPVHFEEALLVCRTILPERAKEVDLFNIREETSLRFDQYVLLYSSGNNPKDIHKMLAKNFKNTYWFYLDFSPYVAPESESNVQLFPQ